ncbi:hypothetical protein P7K49_003128 [Saguinus oedipus]|uniref:BH3-interacting domain death agonist n=1 Tax=Saguinus oedipus TaxID=9490 RepID=A0ABQ9WJA5_SAGOE|nr:hypothetical protein P7K49_003128 [Saguinus oedipus]
MDRSIPPDLVNHLALQLRNTSRSEEDRRRDLASALEQLLQAHPTDMDKEKTMLVLALLLAKKVANHTPSLLRDVFRTTVNFINQNLRAYVRSLTRNKEVSLRRFLDNFYRHPRKRGTSGEDVCSSLYGQLIRG